MPALLRRIFGRAFAPADPAAEPVPFGPRYTLSGDRLAIESGPLAGTALRIERSVSDTTADFAFFLTDPRPSPLPPSSLLAPRSFLLPSPAKLRRFSAALRLGARN